MKITMAFRAVMLTLGMAASLLFLWAIGRAVDTPARLAHVFVGAVIGMFLAEFLFRRWEARQ